MLFEEASPFEGFSTKVTNMFDGGLFMFFHVTLHGTFGMFSMKLFKAFITSSDGFDMLYKSTAFEGFKITS